MCSDRERGVLPGESSKGVRWKQNGKTWQSSNSVISPKLLASAWLHGEALECMLHLQFMPPQGWAAELSYSCAVSPSGSGWGNINSQVLSASAQVSKGLQEPWSHLPKRQKSTEVWGGSRDLRGCEYSQCRWHPLSYLTQKSEALTLESSCSFILCIASVTKSYRDPGFLSKWFWPLLCSPLSHLAWTTKDSLLPGHHASSQRTGQLIFHNTGYIDLICPSLFKIFQYLPIIFKMKLELLSFPHPPAIHALDSVLPAHQLWLFGLRTTYTLKI